MNKKESIDAPGAREECAMFRAIVACKRAGRSDGQIAEVYLAAMAEVSGASIRISLTYPRAVKVARVVNRKGARA